MVMAVATLVALVLCVLSYLFAAFAYRILRLWLRGVRTTGELVDYRVDHDGDGAIRYFLTLAFELPDGTCVESESQNPVLHFLAVRPGETTEVTYDPAVPTRVNASALETTDTGFGDALAYVVGSAACLIGPGAFVIKGFGI